MVHGREAELPASVTTQDPDPPTSLLQYTHNLHQSLNTAFLYARSRNDQARARQKFMYDKKERSLVYKPGDLVWLNDPTTSRSKLAPNCMTASRNNWSYTRTDSILSIQVDSAHQS